VATRLDGVFEQQALGEGMQRRDGRMVETLERSSEDRIGTCLGDLVQQTHPDALAKFGRGLLGEGDGGDLVDRGPGGDQRDDPVDERLGLAGPGAGLDEQRGVEIAGDAIACALIGDGGEDRHQPITSGSARVR
jgi:hypothetical protein